MSVIRVVYALVVVDVVVDAVAEMVVDVGAVGVVV